MNAFNQAHLTIQGCGYRIENDRVIVTIQRIANDRVEGNLSGTLQLQLCAFQQGVGNAEAIVLASTMIGEMKGQHFLSDCHYDLLFQQLPAGNWQLVLQLNEWNGVDYTLCDSAYFDAPYQIEASAGYSASAMKIKELEGEKAASTPKIATENPIVKKSKEVKKNATGYADGYLAINKSKVDKLLKVKGVPKKVLEKLVAERPFRSEKAVLNVKGVGPVMLGKIVAELSR
jgi:DNA uptake protein ComE-like DNA-binding protein